MTPLDLSVPLGLGVVSSFHCVGMCGPIVLAYTLPIRQSGRDGLIRAHLAYNAGRIVTYSMLGAIAGLLGGGVVTLGGMAGLERQAAILIGLLMIFAGVLAGGWIPNHRLVQIGGSVPGAFSRVFGTLVRSGGAGSKFVLGTVMGLLPCGLVYAALLQAMSTSRALDGALSMAAFGLGTAASLVGIGLVSGAITARLARYSGALVSLSVILIGVLVTWRGMTGPMVRCH